VGSSPTAPISSFWGRGQIGKALVLQTSNCGFESRRLHFFRMWDSGRPPVLGTGSRWFNSSHPDFVRVAQRNIERWFTKPEVVSSNLSTGIKFGWLAQQAERSVEARQDKVRVLDQPLSFCPQGCGGSSARLVSERSSVRFRLRACKISIIFRSGSVV
jgi:hypothetical protein